MNGLQSTSIICQSFTSTFEVIKKTPVVIKVLEISQKISVFILSYFNVLQGLGMASLGAKAILSEVVRRVRQSALYNPTTHFIKNFFLKLDQEWAPTGFNVLHGILYFGAGISCALSAVPKLQSMHVYVNVLKSTGNGLFILANLFSLEYYIKAYQEASETISNEHSEFQRQAAERIKTSSVLGVINSASYLLAPAVSLVGAPALLAIMFGLIAVSTGGIKIFYDYFYLS